jgi:hypothetical protein
MPEEHVGHALDASRCVYEEILSPEIGRRGGGGDNGSRLNGTRLRAANFGCPNIIISPFFQPSDLRTDNMLAFSPLTL